MPAGSEVVYGVAARVDEGVIHTGAMSPRDAHTPRLQDRGDATGHGDRGEMADSLEATKVGDEQLASPQSAVGPVAEAVEGQGEHRAGPAVLGQARRDVGMVVLHADGRKVEVRGELGREVFGVQVVGDELGDHGVERAEMVDRLHEGAVRSEVLEVTDVVARDDVVAHGHRHRALELGPDGQDRPARRHHHREGLRREPA